MSYFKAISAAVILPGMLLSGAAFAGVAQGESTEGGSGTQCVRSVIDRSQGAGVYDVTRQVFEDNKCICYAYTGPKPQADSIESAIVELQNSRRCEDAKVQAMNMPLSGAGGGSSSISSIGRIAPFVAAGAAGAGILISQSDDKKKPTSP